jgi:NADH-quinone oxidoreductase subunit L
MNESFVCLLLVLPLMGGILPLLLAKIAPKHIESAAWVWVAPTLNALAAVLALSLVFLVPFKIRLFQWVAIEDISIAWVLHYDFLAATVSCVVCIISTLVQLYSITYMKEDLRRIEFLSYLSLFSFAMLLLVTADNLLQMFLGWEGIGICSYILIGFWHYKVSASQAAFKALIMNRIGDAAFVLAMAWIFAMTGNLSLETITGDMATSPSWSWWVPGGLFLIAAMVKSAQFGLHTWLPDAMEGPTPVSALLHAATMVTAGIYLLLRLSPLLEAVSFLKPVILIIGCVTALVMALIALNQYDLKKIIAYSTASQLGFMMMAIGLGSYTLALFHLVTHAFFKSLLFLGAGAVIHHMEGEQDIRHMGGLWRQMPLTYCTFLIASLSMAGFPFLAGHYSKEAIILYGWAEYGLWLYGFGLLLVLLTSLYVFRVFILVFHREARVTPEKSHGHLGFQIPLMVLALLSTISGYLLAPYFYRTSIPIPMEAHIFSPLMMLLGIVFMVLCYGLKSPILRENLKYGEWFHRILLHKLYVDEAYTFLFVSPFRNVSTFLAEKLDLKYMDQRLFGSIPTAASHLHEWVKRLHSGYLPNYMVILTLGLIVIIAYLVRGSI